MSEPMDPEEHPEQLSDGFLDAGLAAAFGPDSEPPDEGVLAALGAGVGVTLRVLTAAGATDASADPAAPPRYELQGEIARGGMGVVLHGRDAELGRDVAFKVLLETHKDNPALRQRFIEEARIAGQLQHPGVAPVYEMGQTADRRPCFTMKLVKGRTLAARLAERPDPNQDPPFFLKIFEQVCQTVAYAHSRRVIHRDLKPANVMVGDFGEVLVMDWGLAKVLKRGAAEAPSTPTTAPDPDGGTHAGTVMGTPAYMAPEQARGETERLDERCDVFGLGAILCEILTGKPAYVGADAAELRRKAESGDLKEAMDRLAASGADADLRKLAEECLAPMPEGRPRDAGAVATAAAAYQAAVQERLRKAELERVEMQARAEANVKSRVAAEAQAEAERREYAAVQARNTAERRAWRFRATAAVLLLVVSGGTWWAWSAHNESSRREIAKEAESKYYLALARETNGQLAEAAEVLQQLLIAEPNYVPGYLKLGDVLAKQEKLDDSVAAYRKATEIAPQNAFAFSKLGYALLEQGKVDDAVSVLHRAVELDAKNSSARYNLGVALERQGKSEEAAADFRESLNLDYKNADALFALGRLLHEKGDWAAAAADYKQGIALNPDFAEGYIKLGFALLDGQEDAAAAEALQKAETLRPNDPKTSSRLCWAFEELGTAFELQGDEEKAVAAYSSELEIALKFPIPRDGLWPDPLQSLARMLKDQDTDDETLALIRRGMRHYLLTGDFIHCNNEFLVGAYERQDRLGELLDFLEQCRKEVPEDRMELRHYFAVIIMDIRDEQRQRIEVDGRLPEIIEGKDKGLPWLDMSKVAEYCASSRWRLYGTAARLYGKVWVNKEGWAPQAVDAAVLASFGQGADASKLNDLERAHLRAQALAWLQDHLAELEKVGRLKDEPFRVVQAVNRLYHDRALAGVRDEEQLAKLPAEERVEWSNFWADVSALRKRVAQGCRDNRISLWWRYM